MNHEVKQRLGWIKLYEQLGDAGIVCRKCGISRPTLRKWWRRYQQQGIAGPQSQSKRPHHSPNQKVTAQQEAWILELRQRRLGVRRIQNELAREYDCHLAIATIDKVLKRLKQPLLKTTRTLHKGTKRYQRSIPGERVQMDVCKVASKLYQYTAIDDCTRIKVLRLYSNREASSSLDFLEHVIALLPFPIERLQTDRGQEFFAYEFQDRLRK
jgi:transposase